MKKLSVFKRKLIRRYNNKSLWEYSKYKGYEGFFGYYSLKAMLQGETKIFQEAYGNNLRHWRYL